PNCSKLVLLPICSLSQSERRSVSVSDSRLIARSAPPSITHTIGDVLMSNPNLSGSGFRGALLRRLTLIAVLFLTPLTAIRSQEHDDDHDHDHLHFSHPLVTESPSPDTK